MILDEIHLLGADRGPILEVYSYEWWQHTCDYLIILSYFSIVYLVLLGITVITVYNSPNYSLVFHTALGTINTQAALHVNLNPKY